MTKSSSATWFPNSFQMALLAHCKEAFVNREQPRFVPHTLMDTRYSAEKLQAHFKWNTDLAGLVVSIAAEKCVETRVCSMKQDEIGSRGGRGEMIEL